MIVQEMGVGVGGRWLVKKRGYENEKAKPEITKQKFTLKEWTKETQNKTKTIEWK